MDKERIIQGVVGFLDDGNISNDIIKFVEEQMEKLYNIGYEAGKQDENERWYDQYIGDY
jgi:hypothetical protein